MSLKSQIIRLLVDAGDDFVSGNSLATALSVSRSAVWKAVEALRADGFCISAVTNRGYRLLDYGDVLSPAGVERYIRTGGVFTVEVRKTVTSTNTVLRELAAAGAPEGYVLAAEEQTAGKGRLGRSFYSPAGHGVYFSLLLRPGLASAPQRAGLEPAAVRPALKQGEAAFITSAAAVAAARAIESVLGVQVGIKWVNDLLLADRKVCGILTEASVDIESGSLDHAVLGIGINITAPESGYPDVISDVAAPVLESAAGAESVRCRIIASTLDNFWAFYENLSRRDFLDEYRRRSVVVGREIFVLSGSDRIPARALAIDDDCRLVVRYQCGDTAALNAGEVSIRSGDGR